MKVDLKHNVATNLVQKSSFLLALDVSADFRKGKKSKIKQQ